MSVLVARYVRQSISRKLSPAREPCGCENDRPWIVPVGKIYARRVHRSLSRAKHFDFCPRTLFSSALITPRKTARIARARDVIDLHFGLFVVWFCRWRKKARRSFNALSRVFTHLGRQVLEVTQDVPVDGTTTKTREEAIRSRRLFAPTRHMWAYRYYLCTYASLRPVTVEEETRVPRWKTGKFGGWCATVLGQVVTAPRVVRVRPSRRHCSRLYIHVCVHSSPWDYIYIYAIRNVFLKLEQDSRIAFFSFVNWNLSFFLQENLARLFDIPRNFIS